MTDADVVLGYIEHHNRPETEALLLESNLIKRLKPRYNVSYRDDKSFPNILLREDHPFPQLLKHRGARTTKGVYFGPFASAGAVVRRKVSPTQPRSSSQNSVRSNFAYLSKRWANDLTAADRAGWIALAVANPRTDVFGNTIVLTGLQLYQACNRALASIGQAYIDAPPATLSAETPGALTVVADTAGPTLTVEPATFNTAADGWVILAGPQQNPGRKFIGSALRQVKNGVTVLAAAQTFLTEYVAKFGSLIAARAIPVGMVYINKTTGALGIATTTIEVVA